ncbi:MAG TPA: TonB family protein [Gallionellaceae bacterium]|nr:TonB family protein [Gallionellaceae bacterium]
MKLPATNFLSSPSPLQLSLGGSVLLHAVLLFGLPAPSPSSRATTVAALEAHLAPTLQRTTAHAATVQPAPTPAIRDSLPIDAPLPQPDSFAPTPAGETGTSAAASAEPTYFSAAQLDSPPRLLGELQQIYPARARAAEVEGYVTLALLINERGEVEDVSVVRAQPAGYFEEAALNMLRKQRFSPPIKQNRAVKSRWLTTVHYRLQS